MAPALPLNARQIIKALLEEGLRQGDVAQRVVASETTVKWVWLLVRTHALSKSLFTPLGAIIEKITPDIEEVRCIRAIYC
jgi:hypothetical protein